MEKAPCTDFLFPTPSFMRGAGSVLELYPGTIPYNGAEDPDAVATALDWIMVGEDIRVAIGLAKSEPSPSR